MQIVPEQESEIRRIQIKGSFSVYAGIFQCGDMPVSH